MFSVLLLADFVACESVSCAVTLLFPFFLTLEKQLLLMSILLNCFCFFFFFFFLMLTFSWWAWLCMCAGSVWDGVNQSTLWLWGSRCSLFIPVCLISRLYVEISYYQMHKLRIFKNDELKKMKARSRFKKKKK